MTSTAQRYLITVTYVRHDFTAVLPAGSKTLEPIRERHVETYVATLASWWPKGRHPECGLVKMAIETPENAKTHLGLKAAGWKVEQTSGRFPTESDELVHDAAEQACPTPIEALPAPQPAKDAPTMNFRISTSRLSAFKTAYAALMGAGKFVGYAAGATPILMLSAVGAGFVPATVGADALVPVTSAVLAAAIVLGIMGQATLWMIRRAERQSIMDQYGLTSGCMALTADEIAQGGC